MVLQNQEIVFYSSFFCMFGGDRIAFSQVTSVCVVEANNEVSIAPLWLHYCTVKNQKHQHVFLRNSNACH